MIESLHYPLEEMDIELVLSWLYVYTQKNRKFKNIEAYNLRIADRFYNMAV